MCGLAVRCCANALKKVDVLQLYVKWLEALQSRRPFLMMLCPFVASWMALTGGFKWLDDNLLISFGTGLLLKSLALCADLTGYLADRQNAYDDVASD